MYDSRRGFNTAGTDELGNQEKARLKVGLAGVAKKSLLSPLKFFPATNKMFESRNGSLNVFVSLFNSI